MTLKSTDSPTWQSSPCSGSSPSLPKGESWSSRSVAAQPDLMKTVRAPTIGGVPSKFMGKMARAPNKGWAHTNDLRNTRVHAQTREIHPRPNVPYGSPDRWTLGNKGSLFAMAQATPIIRASILQVKDILAGGSGRTRSP